MEGASRAREGHGLQSSIGLILRMQQSPYLGGGIAFTQKQDVRPLHPQHHYPKACGALSVFLLQWHVGSSNPDIHPNVPAPPIQCLTVQ